MRPAIDELYHGARAFTIGDGIAWREHDDVWEFEVIGHWQVMGIMVDGTLVRQFLETEETEPAVPKQKILEEQDLFALIFTHVEHSEHWENSSIRPINKPIDQEKLNRTYFENLQGLPLARNEKQGARLRLIRSE